MDEEVEIDITLSEGFNDALNARLLIGCIEFLLYQRQQIPLPFHELKRMVEDHEKSPCTLPKQHRNGRFGRGFSSGEYRKAKKAYEDLESLFDHINKLFASTRVYSAVVLLGSTPVSPKEKYIVKFPRTEQLTPVEMSSRACNSTCRKMVRCLISDQQLGSFKDISPTSTIVFVHAGRSSEIEWFRPKPMFKLPYRGQSCKITLKSCDEHGGEGGNITCHNDDGDNDRLWFQAPVTIRGYKHRTGAFM